MKYLILILALAVANYSQGQNSTAKPSKQVRKYLDEVYYLIKLRALYSDSIDWKELDKKIAAISKGMNTIEEARPLVDTMMHTLRKAGDLHSFITYPQDAQKLLGSNSDIKLASSNYLGDGIGYIKIPEFASLNAHDRSIFASSIQIQIRQIDEGNAISGWIVDLRGDRGGSVDPMVKGLSALIGDGVYAYVKVRKRFFPLSTLEEGDRAIKLESPYQVKNPSNKIAVLIDSNTGSSGEVSAMAFKTLPNVKFFGQPSAGYTSANSTINLSDGSILFLAIGYMTDRKQNTYIPNIVPDVITPSELNGSKDLTIEAAKEWLHIK